jgi:predicted nuclease of restriction endonuclease-like (RecB) superfamily
MNKCLEDGWSDSILIYQIETNLYEREEKAVKHNNFNLTLKQNGDLANNMMKEPYVFDLIELTSDYKEKELENKMLERIKNVLLELGNGFSFVGNQYKVTVDDQDFYIDLLFYHIKLKCYVAVELKVVEFKPEFAGKMEFYLTVLDEEVKDENDNSSIGIILCQNKSNKIVDYTLKYINKPVGVSEYKILDKLSDDILDKLPTEEDINLHIDVD